LWAVITNRALRKSEKEKFKKKKVSKNKRKFRWGGLGERLW